MYAIAYYNRQRAQAHKEKSKRSLWRVGWVLSFFVAAYVVYTFRPNRRFPARNIDPAVMEYVGSFRGPAVAEDPRLLALFPTPSSTLPPSASPSGTAAASSSPSASLAESPSGTPPVSQTRTPAAAVAAGQTAALSDPTWNSSWVEPQFPLEHSVERTLTSHKFKELTAHSENPPVAPVGQLANRLIIAVGCGVHGSWGDVKPENIKDLPLIMTLLTSFMPTAQPHHLYRRVR